MQALSPFTQIKILEFIQSRKYTDLIYAPGQEGCAELWNHLPAVPAGKVSRERGGKLLLPGGELGCRAARALGPNRRL